MKKALKLCVILIICLSAIFSLTACKNGGTVNEIKTEKPDYARVYANYADLNVKHSDFSGGVQIKLFGSKAESDMTFGAGVDMARIQNGERLYIDGKFSGKYASENIKALLNLFSAGDLIGYLNGSNYEKFSLGYNEAGGYNAKAEYYENNEKTEYCYWYGIDTSVIAQFLTELAKEGIDVTKLLGTNLSLNKYLMYSSFVDFNNLSSWVTGDGAGKYLTQNGDYGYDLLLNKDKIREYILNAITDSLEVFDKESFAKPLEKINTALEYVKKWLVIGDSTLVASANSSSLPNSCVTTAKVSLNVDVEELKKIVDLFIIGTDEEVAAKTEERKQKDKENAEQIKAMVGAVALICRGIPTNNDTTSRVKNKIGIEFTLTMGEKFSYAEDKVNLSASGIDQDLFADTAQDIEGREEIRLEDVIPPDDDTTTE